MNLKPDQKQFQMITPLSKDQRAYLEDKFTSLMTLADFVEKRVHEIKMDCSRELEKIRKF